MVRKSKAFIQFFTKLGTDDVTEELISAAEEYVCALYGKPKVKDVNEARSKIFGEKYKKKKKVVELSLLPPCKENLKYHLVRSNYIAKLMRSTSLSTIVDEFAEHGWTAMGEPIWSQDHMPEDIRDILQESDDLTSDDKEGDKLLDDVDEGEEMMNEDDDEDVEVVDHS